MSSNPYGARCFGWTPNVPKEPKLSKKDQDQIERNLTWAEQIAVPDNALCIWYDQLKMLCDYHYVGGRCPYLGKK